MLDYALAYARRGWKVFPLAVRDKMPLIKDGRGCLDATTEREQILKWWAKCPSANIGIATGESFFVLDIDPKNNGNLWLETVDLPDTIQQQTGSGGTHYLFSGPPDIPNSSGKIAPGVDIRGFNGYIVAPPSIHPNGNRYTWLDCEGIPTEDPSLSPGWLMNAASGKKKNGMPPVPEVIKKGVQHDTLFRYASSLWAGKTKMSEAEVMAATVILSKRCEEVPPEENVEKIVHSVTRKYPQGMSPEYAAKVKVKEEPTPEPTEPESISADWQQLLHKERGKPKPVLINTDIALRYSPEWSGVLAFDEFKQKIRVVSQPPIGGKWPRDWTDADDTNTAVWMQSNGIYVGRDTVSSAVHSVSQENKIHVVREYLNSLQWDGNPRIGTWMQRYLKTDNTQVIRMIGERWLISAVARIMQPGCQCDYMLVLEGVQGLKKSTALKTLAGPDWFCDHSPDLHDKDSQMQLQGSWIIEWAELDSLRKSEVTAVKNFLSRREEKFRPPYGRYVVEMPRQCVFAGTTNESFWQKDETGGRRFWPAECGAIDIEALQRDRDQLWAESLVRFTDGAIWWPETKEEHEMLAKEQESRMELDVWQSNIEKFLNGDEFTPALTEVTVQQILSKCLGVPLSSQSHGEKLRVGKVMRALKWNYVQERIHGTDKHFSGYRRP